MTSSPAAASALRIIRDEHRTLTSVIGSLQLLVHDAAMAAAPNFELFTVILDCIEMFPDRFRHPKEDEHLFTRMRRQAIADAFGANTDLRLGTPDRQDLQALFRLILNRAPAPIGLAQQVKRGPGPSRHDTDHTDGEPMQLARIKTETGTAVAAAWIDGKAIELPASQDPAFADLATLMAGAALGRAETYARQALAAGKGVDAGRVQFLSPTVPMVFLGLGYNYRALARNEGVPFNKHPELFAKLPGAPWAMITR